MKSLSFPGRTKHDKLDFHPGVVYAFEDSSAEAFMIVAYGAVDEGAVDPSVVVGTNEVYIDPDTVWGTGDNRGQKVLP